MTDTWRVKRCVIIIIIIIIIIRAKEATCNLVVMSVVLSVIL